MKQDRSRKKLSKEEKAALFTEMRAAARGKEIFPDAMAEARKFGELLKKSQFAPGVKL